MLCRSIRSPRIERAAQPDHPAAFALSGAFAARKVRTGPPADKISFPMFRLFFG
jgi:hypothetical protein